MYFWIISTALVGFLLCMFLVDTMQVLLRAVSSLVSAPVLGAHLGSVFMLANRAATALALVMIGYLVDIFTPQRHLLVIYIVAALIIATCHMLFTNRRFLLRLTLFCFRRIYKRSLSPDQVSDADASLYPPAAWRINPAVTLVTSVGLVGLLAPSLLAAAFPSYRATLMQTGFILNSVASIISVLHVERTIALTIDEGNPATVNRLYGSYVASRTSGYVVAALVFLTILIVTACTGSSNA